MNKLFAAALLVMATESAARDFGQYQNVDPATRQWFRSQRNPTTGGLCCSEADGTYAEEDIRDGHYWARFEFRGMATDWMPVPDDAVIRDPNKNGAPVVWWFVEGGQLKIRCYSPGAGI